MIVVVINLLGFRKDLKKKRLDDHPIDRLIVVVALYPDYLFILPA